MLLLSIFLSLNSLCIVIVAMKITSQSDEIYDLRARILDLEIKETNKKSATLHRIK